MWACTAVIQALYRKPNTSKKHPGHTVYPHLLRGKKIERANEVWAMDITYIPMARGWVYLAAVVDWASRRVLAYRVSISMDSGARQRIGRFIEFYNTRRPHSSLGKNTPDEFYFASLPAIQQAA